MSAPTAPADSLLLRALGIIRSPRTTFEAIVRAPRWCGVVILTFLLTAGCTAILLETEVGQLALLDQWDHTAFAFGQPIDDRQYAAMEAASQNGAAYATLSALFGGPVLTIGLSGLLFASFQASRGAGRGAKRPHGPVLAGRSGLADRPVTYRQVLAVTAHAATILALRQVIAAPLRYARETLASPTTMSLFFGVLDEGSLPARFFGLIDLFVIWWIVVLAVGLSVLYQRPARPLAVALVGAYVTLAVVLAVVMAVIGGTA